MGPPVRRQKYLDTARQTLDWIGGDIDLDTKHRFHATELTLCVVNGSMDIPALSQPQVRAMRVSENQ